MLSGMSAQSPPLTLGTSLPIGQSWLYPAPRAIVYWVLTWPVRLTFLWSCFWDWKIPAHFSLGQRWCHVSSCSERSRGNRSSKRDESKVDFQKAAKRKILEGEKAAWLLNGFQGPGSYSSWSLAAPSLGSMRYLWKPVLNSLLKKIKSNICEWLYSSPESYFSFSLKYFPDYESHLHCRNFN